MVYGAMHLMPKRQLKDTQVCDIFHSGELASQPRNTRATENMAASVRVRTWNSKARSVKPWLLLLTGIILLGDVNRGVMAAPEPGQWSITVVNVSIKIFNLSSCQAKVRFRVN
jgi:hypothetical protein